MRNPHAMLLGLSLAAAGASLAGCGSDPQAPAVGDSQARLVVSNQGQSPASMNVTAADEDTGVVAIDKTIDLQPGGVTVLDLTLPAATYTFTASLAGASGDADLGSAQASLAAGSTTQIQLAATAGAKGAGAVQVAVGAVPQIGGVDVQLDGSGAAAMVSVHVDASTPGGGALSFFWSGAGLSGVVQGSSTLTLSAADVAAEVAPVVHVVVQDAAGVATSADVALAIAAGAAQGTISSSGSTPSAACLGAQAQCAASCGAGLGASLGTVVSGTVNATCLASCGASLATCAAQ